MMAFWRIKLDTEPSFGRSKKMSFKKSFLSGPPLDSIDEGPNIKDVPALRDLLTKIDQELETLETNRTNTAEQIEKLFKKCHETLTKLEKEQLLDVDEICNDKERNLQSQRANISQSLGKFQTLDDVSEIGPLPQEIYSNPERRTVPSDKFSDWSSSVGNIPSLSLSLRGHNQAARDAPQSGSNRMQPVECSYVDVRFNQGALVHMLDKAIEKQVKLCSSEASPSRTRVTIGTALVNHVTNVKVKTKYADGEECEQGGEPLNALFSCPDGTKIAGTVKDNNNGYYDVAFTPTSPGTHILTLKIQNTEIGHSPYEVYVSPVCPSNCTAEASPSMVDYAGLAKVVTRDINGNPCHFGGERVAADMRDPHGASVACSIDDNKNGTYDVTFNPSMAGLHALKVTIHDENIRDNPLELPVRAISAKYSRVKIKRARTARPSHATLQALDHNGKRLRHGGDLVKAQLYNEQDQSQRCTVKDNHNGTYTITYIPPAPGEYLLGISIYRMSVCSDKPFVVCVPLKEDGFWQDVVDKWYDLTDWFDEKLQNKSTVVKTATHSWSTEQLPAHAEEAKEHICVIF